jgi:hypothetical protein
MKTLVPNDQLDKLDEVRKAVDGQMTQLDQEYK